MLGAPCSPCCASGQCPESIVVQVSPSLTSTKWLANHGGCFILVNKISASTDNKDCLMSGQVSAYTARFGRDYCGGIPTQTLDVFGVLKSIDSAGGPGGGYLHVRSLYDQCDASNLGVENTGGGEIDPYTNTTESFSIPGQLTWWTLNAWNAAKADPNNSSVPTDARLLTSASVLNPWDFDRSDVPVKYRMTISDLPGGSGHFAKFGGVYDIPGPRGSNLVNWGGYDPDSIFFSDWPQVDYSTNLSPQPLRYRITGYAGLTFGYPHNGQYPLSLEVRLVLQEYADQYTIVRTTQLTTHVPPFHLFAGNPQPWASVSWASKRPAPDGLTGQDEFAANIHLLAADFFGYGEYGPSVGTCRITLSSVMP